jgi:hypothetical protein
MFANSKKKIAIMTMTMNIIFATAFYLLGGISGSTMSIIMFLFTLTEFLVLEKIWPTIVKNWLDKLVYIPVIISGYFTYNGIGSLMPVLGTSFSLLSISLRTPFQIKLVSLFSNTAYLFYNIFLKNYVGIAFEVGILIANIIGIFTEFRGEKKTKNNQVNPQRKLKK